MKIPGVMLILLAVIPPAARAGNPYDEQIAAQVRQLSGRDARVREAAAESLGYVRAWSAADGLVAALADEAAPVRREAALSLGFCGGRKHLPPLLDRLNDPEWSVRQAAWIALTNLSGMEFPFDALAAAPTRETQVRAWRAWCEAIPADAAPKEILDLLQGGAAGNLAGGCPVTASSVYRGPADALTDGNPETFWQTKQVPFPQHCTIDLGQLASFTRVVIQQYGPGYCMTDFVLSISDDGKTFKDVHRGDGSADPHLILQLPPTKARFLKITSHGSQKPTYPTTIREIEVYADAPGAKDGANPYWRKERAFRAMAALRVPGASEIIAKQLERYRTVSAADSSQKAMVQAGIRALGRLGDPASLPILIDFLNTPHWARYAAEALGDLGDERAVEALVKVFPEYALSLKGAVPKLAPRDDRPGLDPSDRMYEAPYQMALALARLPLTKPESQKAVASIMPLLLANLPGDFDGALFYETEAAKEVATYLLSRTGTLDVARRAAFKAVGRNVEIPASDPPEFLQAASRKVGTAIHAPCWLPAIARDAKLVPDLIAMLDHEDGWVRINAAKTLMFMGEKSAIEPIAKILAVSKREADFGYFGGFLFAKPTQGQDEYNDPSPRWREAYARALGRLGAAQHIPLLSKLLDDEDNALEIRYAAAQALDEIGTPEALDILAQAQQSHPFHSIRLVAREALWKHNRLAPADNTDTNGTTHPATTPAQPAPSSPAQLHGIVFIKGDRAMPNRFQIDPWRQTYSTTDSGPTYRLGRNLYLLKLQSPIGNRQSTLGNASGLSTQDSALSPQSAIGNRQSAINPPSATPLTQFQDGYVADCEVSWDGKKIVFARRGGDTDPWWHIWEIHADGSNLRQLTRGPYHDVQPAYMPDGRIVFSSSRIGLRDEYHGYFATGLTIMNADGSDIHSIGFNLGRDNEPSLLPDGRIVFSRLELFYSRLKTEICLEAIYPDGTHNVTLYGPERRLFWREVTLESGEKWWGEVPPRHRVLRLTQAQSLDAQNILCASSAGLVQVGNSRLREQLIPHDRNFAVTTPFPLDNDRLLCAAALKGKSPLKTPDTDTVENDLALYVMDRHTGKMELLYNDPATADFEPRPLMARTPPPVLPEAPASRSNAYTAKFVCASARITQEPLVKERGRLVRIIEGTPIVGRHATHLSPGVNAWKNHTGTVARVLGTLPLAGDGSFYVEVPADRLIHFQVLDSDRRVMGNQLLWMYGRPGETRSCVGCHENPQTSPVAGRLKPAAAALAPIPCLPTGGEFTYRAKFWNKGVLSDEGEERTRTVRAINLIGRQ